MEKEEGMEPQTINPSSSSSAPPQPSSSLKVCPTSPDAGSLKRKDPPPAAGEILCFKCSGSGRIITKKKKQPGQPLAFPEGIDPDSIKILSEGLKKVHFDMPCHVCAGHGHMKSSVIKKPKEGEGRGEGAGGLITIARRPVNFTPKGPVPPPLGTIIPEEGEALCYLTGDWRILQLFGGHRYSTDDVVTAWVGGKEVKGLWLEVKRRMMKEDKEQEEEEVTFKGLDIGCGLGSVLLMMCWQFPSSSYVGIEAQNQSVTRARRSAQANGCESRVDIRHGDLREIAQAVPEGAVFDIITGTPPYFDAHGASPIASMHKDPAINVTSLGDRNVMKKASGKPRHQPVTLPIAEDQRPCNFEYRGGVEVYCQAAKACLGPQGLYMMCASDIPGVEARVKHAAQDAGLAILRKVGVRPKEGQPSLFAVYTFCHAHEAPSFLALMEEGQEEKKKGQHSLAASSSSSSKLSYLLLPSAAALDQQQSQQEGGGEGGGGGEQKEGEEEEPVANDENEGIMNRRSGEARANEGSKERGMMVIRRREMLVVRTWDGKQRTADYRRLMDDMSMPDNTCDH